MPSPAIPSTLDVLSTALGALGVPVVDLRAELPTHPEKRFDLRSIDDLEGLCFHQNQGRKGEADTVKAIARYHVEPSQPGAPNHLSPTGAPGICYTLCISPRGTVYVCNDLEAVTWSQGRHAWNRLYLAACVLGNFPGTGHVGYGKAPTVEQLFAVLALIRASRFVWGPHFEALGHFHFGEAACPGRAIKSLLRELGK
jgi:hypothetical protein